MTAGEEQAEHVVLPVVDREGRVRGGGGSVFPRDEKSQLVGLDRGTLEQVERPPTGRDREPRTRHPWDAVDRPRGQRSFEGIRRAVLGKRPIAGEPHQRAEYPPPFVAMGDRERGPHLGRSRECGPRGRHQP